MGNEGFIINEKWPEFNIPSISNSINHCKMLNLLMKSIEDFRRSMDKWSNSKKGQGNIKVKPNCGIIYVADTYKDWQIEGLNQVKNIIINEGELPKDYISKLRKTPVIEKMDKNMLKNVLSFISLKANEYKEDKSAFDVNLPFDEFELFCKQSYFIAKSLGIKEIKVKLLKDCKEIAEEKLSQVIPNRPLINFQ